MNAALRALNAELPLARGQIAPALTSERNGFARFRTPFVLAGALLLAVGGTALILAPAGSESTDDAYVGVDATTIAPKVRGLVAEVLVRDNQSVHAGDPLLQIDAEEFDARVGSA